MALLRQGSSRITEENIRGRLQREKAKTGAITVSLAWNNPSDLDLHAEVHPASGGRHTISYRNKQAGGGVLDVDMHCRDDEVSAEPIENIYWKKPPAGQYVISVKLYKRRGGGEEPIKFRAILKREDEEDLSVEGQVGGGIPTSVVTVFRFSVDGDGEVTMGAAAAPKLGAMKAAKKGKAMKMPRTASDTQLAKAAKRLPKAKASQKAARGKAAAAGHKLKRANKAYDLLVKQVATAKAKLKEATSKLRPGKVAVQAASKHAAKASSAAQKAKGGADDKAKTITTITKSKAQKIKKAQIASAAAAKQAAKASAAAGKKLAKKSAAVAQRLAKASAAASEKAEKAKAVAAKKAGKTKALVKMSSKALVFKGDKVKTKTGLKKADLVKSKKGRIVSAKKSAGARSSKWIKAVAKARAEKGYTGFKAIKRGTSFHDRALEIVKGM